MAKRERPTTKQTTDLFRESYELLNNPLVNQQDVHKNSRMKEIEQLVTHMEKRKTQIAGKPEVNTQGQDETIINH